MDIDDNGLSKPKSQQAFALYQKIGQMIFDSSSFFQDAQRENAVKLRREKFSRRSRKKRTFARLYSCFLSWVEVKSSRKREIAAAHMALPTPYEPMKSVTTTQHNDRYGHTTRSIIPAGEAFFKDKIEGRIGYLCYALISGVGFYARHRFFAFPAGTRGRGTPARRDACRKPKGRPFAMGKAVPQGRKRP